MEQLDTKALRSAFGSFMTGVAIVTAQAADGSPVAFTANSFTSVSIEPPLLLVCPGNHLSSFEVFRNCKNFAVNILREDQQNVSNVFASFNGDRFAEVEWHFDSNGSPLIDGSLTSFSCTTHQKLEAGDHLVLVGKVDRFISSDGLGLGYWRGGYFSISQEREAQAPSKPDELVVVGAIVENSDAIFVLQKNGKLKLPTKELSDQTQAREGIDRFLEGLGLDADVGRVYSVFDDTKNQKRFIYFRTGNTTRTDSSNGGFLNLETVVDAEWHDASEKVMVQRYLAERKINQFGLYIGGRDAGEVHPEKHV